MTFRLGCFFVLHSNFTRYDVRWLEDSENNGNKNYQGNPLEGVIAETAGAFTLYITEMLKIPVSTTHTITGAIIGVGATKRLSAVRWE